MSKTIYPIIYSQNIESRVDQKYQQSFILQPSQADNLGSSRMSINSSGKLKSIANQYKENNACKESLSSLGYSVNTSYAFGGARSDKPTPKERKDSSKKHTSQVKY